MFERQQAAIAIRDIDLKPEVLQERVESIVTSLDRLQAMAEAAGRLGKAEATQEIVEAIARMANVAVKKRQSMRL